MDRLPVRIREKFDVADRGYLTPCWVWRAATNELGYGKVWFERGTRAAHRVVYALTLGPVPEGLTLDHLCRVPQCVNPEHLEPVPGPENTRRGRKGVLYTHCAHGHEMTPQNTYTPAGSTRRWCRTCKRAAKREARRRGVTV